MSTTVPEAVVTVLCTPDDGCGWHPKHVEWTCRIINGLLCVASRWTIINIWYFKLFNIILLRTLTLLGGVFFSEFPNKILYTVLICPGLPNVTYETFRYVTTLTIFRVDKLWISLLVNFLSPLVLFLRNSKYCIHQSAVKHPWDDRSRFIYFLGFVSLWNVSIDRGLNTSAENIFIWEYKQVFDTETSWSLQVTDSPYTAGFVLRRSDFIL